MRLRLHHLCLIGMLFALPVAHAQIYTCKGPDGSRVFSDKKCGIDAKPVKGFEKTKKKPESKPTKAKSSVAPPVVAKSAEELTDLLNRCNDGNAEACTTWTLSGGPNALREAERNAELACEAGSLADCEERYCKEGINENCRQSVLRTAELSGETWYLRNTEEQTAARTKIFGVRCINKDKKQTRDIVITCSGTPRAKCSASKTSALFDGLKAAATALCAVAK